MVRVKICGITNLEDALAAVEAGADALGFVFAESRRRIDPKDAYSIVQTLPPFIATVGVFADQDSEEIAWIMKRTCIQLAQVHGELSCGGSELSKSIGCPRLIRGIRVRDEEDIRQAAESAGNCGCAAFLLDAHVDGVMGGTGQTFNWPLGAYAKSLINKPIILAGGLKPGNVADAIREVQPYAVDVSTGVESAPGRKDHDKIREFIYNAKHAM